jgi:phage tail sheath gpL-like
MGEILTSARRFLRENWLQVVCFLGLCALALWSGKAAAFGSPVLAMAISFQGIPTTTRVPFVFAEFDSSQSAQGPSLMPYRGLIIAQRTSAGTSLANSLTRVTSVAQAQVAAGRGSMGHLMARAWFANNKATELWLGLVDDNAAGVAATKTLTVTGTATATGTLNLYIGGVYVPVAIASGDTNTAVASAINAAVTANLDLPVTSEVSTNVVTLTARNKGTCGQDLNVRLNYQFGESTPAGVSVAIAAGTTGATNPSLSSLIAALGDQWFHIIAHPYTDATSLSAIESELLSRSGPMRTIDGFAFTSAVGSQSTLSTLGDTRNSQFNLIVGQPGENPPRPPCEFAAGLAGAVAYYANIDPARPMQTIPVLGMLPPADADLFNFTERDLLLHDGIATTKAATGGVVQIERLITTYKTNAAGADDTAYLDVSTGLTLMYLRYSFRNQILSRHPRSKLASDGARIGSGQAVMTPSLMKAEAVAWFQQMEELGLVEGLDQFKRDLVVERNASDPNRLDVLLPPDLMNQLIVTAASVQFRL